MLENFTQSEVATRFGRVRLWRTEDRGPARPLLFGMPGGLAEETDVHKVILSQGLLADGCVLRQPRDLLDGFAFTGPEDLSRALDEILETCFPDRRVVLLGVSAAGVIALGARARNIARVVALDPPLVAANLWPLQAQLAAALRKTAEPAARTFLGAAFGVTADGIERRDHRQVLDRLSAPADVVLASEPLEPQRDVKRLPSLVGEAERRLLAATPGVRLHRFDGTGHNVLGQASGRTRDLIAEACRRAGQDLSRDRLRVDEPLLDATPLTARHILYGGEAAQGFAEAVAAINPQASVATWNPESGPPPDAGFDAVVLDAPPSVEALPDIAAALIPGGQMVARGRGPDAALASEIAAAGLALGRPVDAAGTCIVRAEKAASGAPTPPIAVHFLALADTMMDIRTRLPSRGLASDPGLAMTYHRPPLALPQLPVDQPKVLVLQRPGEVGLDPWRSMMATLIQDGWIGVIEFDDYPPLISEVKGLPEEPQAMTVLGYPHGVQTSTAQLVELFRPLNPETVLFENTVFDLAPFPQGPPPRRIFYGAMVRGRYALEVARALRPALEAAPDVEVVVIGDRGVFDALPTANKRFHDYMGYESYLELMAQCSISLSPIEALPFRDIKSDAKFLDASRAGVLTIASPTIYDQVIRHGENGFLARGVGDWAPLLRQALADEPMRARMARAAWDYVRSERMFADQVARRRDWYWSLWNRRAELNAAVMDRLPGLREMLAARGVKTGRD